MIIGNYKVLAILITTVGSISCKVTVAIESNETERRFKAYEGLCLPGDISTETFRNFAATGAKLSARTAERIFPDLVMGGYKYEGQ